MTGCISAIVETGFGVGFQCTEFGFRSGRGAKCETGILVPATTLTASVCIVTALNVVADVTMNAQAGFSAWNVEVASAVSVANADIFNCFWLWRDNDVSCLSAGCC